MLWHECWHLFIELTLFSNENGPLVIEPFGETLDSDYETNSLDNIKLNFNEEIEESKHPKYLKYNLLEMSVNYFRVAIKKCCLLNGRDVKMKPNNFRRCKVQYMVKRCNILCFMSKVSNSDKFRLNTWKPKHTSLKTMKGHLASSN